MDIGENILSVRNRIEAACKRAGRENDVQLVGVTKTVEAGRIMDALSCGITVIGENHVQEIVEKYQYLSDRAEIDMIGHLQANKIKYIIGKVRMIQSLDSLKLAGEIDKRYRKAGESIDTLLEINIGREPSKTGIDPAEVGDFLRGIEKFGSLRVCGLMTVAPALPDKEQVRPYFRRMKEIFDDAKKLNIGNVRMRYLSMGMTGDFEVAVEEGSNMVRIGTGIFGSRNYKIQRG